MPERKLIKKGDVILLEKGMEVQTDIPEKFINPNAPYSSQVIHTTIEIGKVYTNKPLNRKDATKKMQRFLARQLGVELSENTIVSLIINYLNIDSKVQKFDTSIYEGEYVVKSAGYNTRRLVKIPFLVQCYKKDDPSILVEFYMNSPYISLADN